VRKEEPLQPSNVFDPHSPLAGATVGLLNVTLIVSGIIFVLVAGLVCYCLVRFRGRPDQSEPRQIAGQKHLEVLWTGLPFLILVYLFVLTVRAMSASDPPKSGKPDVVVVGHQFWWEARYDNPSVSTANEIHIPSGRKVLFRLETADVIHDFWVPQLGRKIDLIPDHPQYLWLEADRPGKYEGACAEFCGAQHAWMRIRVIAQPAPEYTRWLEHQSQPATVAPEPAVRHGADLFKQLTCVNCHEIRGATPLLDVGPDLTHVASRTTLGTGVIENTPDNLNRWIRDSQQIKPGNLMPTFALTENQATDLVAYLETLQ
jgi:cytochrome c oxidase subunit 2